MDFRQKKKQPCCQEETGLLHDKWLGNLARDFLLCQIGFFQDLFACNARLGHFLRRQDDVHLFFRQIAVFEDDFPDRAASGIGFLGQHGRPFIADVRQEGRDDADAVVDPGLAGFFVGLDAFEQVFDEGVDSVGQILHGVEEVEGHDRFHDVQFELAVFDAQADGHIVADDLVARLVENFSHDRIDFARHDGRTGLTGRQLQFVEAAARTGSHEAEVVGHLDEHERRSFHIARYFGEDIRVIGHIDEVAGRNEDIAGQHGKFRGDGFDVSRFSVEARADGRAAHVDDEDAFEGPGNALAAAGDSRSIGAHFLAERNGNGILQVGTAHLDDVFEFIGFDIQFRFQFLQGFCQLLAFHAQADFDARREDVVRRLSHVGVVVRRDDVVTAFFFAYDF